jgi:signal transduction histidine kinase
LTLEHDDTLVVEITDDGVGLPNDYEPGAGMTSMRERAEELGGLFLAEPLTGRGTRIRAELPLGP